MIWGVMITIFIGMLIYFKRNRWMCLFDSSQMRCLQGYIDFK